MKKLFISAILLAGFTATQSVNAQEKGAYAKINVGYNFATSKESLLTNRTQLTATSSTVEAVNVSFGKGLNFGAAFGYNFNKNVAAEIGVGYLIGGETEATERTLSGSVFTETVSAKMLSIRPTIVISAGMEKINPYAKFGLQLASATILLKGDDTFTGGTASNETEFTGGFQVGFQAGVGAEFKIDKNLAIFGELNLNSLSYSPTEGKRTKSQTTIGGTTTNNLDGATVNDTQVEFLDSLTTGTTLPSTSKDQELRQTFQFGSLGLNFGVKYNF